MEKKPIEHGAVRVGLGLGLFGVQHDLNSSQTLNISRILYFQMGNGLHMIVVTWNPFYHGHLSSHLSFSGPFFTHGSVVWNIGACRLKVF